jgi:hypothetical protein
VRYSDNVKIPDDVYEPIYSARPYIQSSEDSIALGHYVWNKHLLGFLGKNFSVMLHPEFEDILEFER